MVDLTNGVDDGIVCGDAGGGGGCGSDDADAGDKGSGAILDDGGCGEVGVVSSSDDTDVSGSVGVVSSSDDTDPVCVGSGGYLNDDDGSVFDNSGYADGDVGVVSSSDDADVGDNVSGAHLDDGRKPLPCDAFLGVDVLLDLLSTASFSISLEKVPIGPKNNVYFVVNNDDNIKKRAQGKISQFWDDRGAWKGGGSSKSFYLKGDGIFISVCFKDNKYTVRKKNDNKMSFVPLDPQPPVDNILTLHRYYAKHGSGEQYKKRVSWLSGGTPMAVHEYKGVCPQVNQNSYVRMYPPVMQKLKSETKFKRASEIYSSCDFFEGPTNIRQIYNAKARHESFVNGCTFKNSYTFDNGNI